MKDDGERVELTYGDVRRAAESCPDAKRVLEKLVPVAFAPKEPEWEDVTNEMEIRPGWWSIDGDGNILAMLVRGDYAFQVTVRPRFTYRYKIGEDGRAYHRKA